MSPAKSAGGKIPLLILKGVGNVSFGKGVQRVVTTVTIDERRDKKVTAQEKLSSVMRRLEA